MIFYRFERALYIILWLGLLWLFSVAIPPHTITPLVQYQYAVSSLILTTLIFLVFSVISNKIIAKRISSYIAHNDMLSALNYVSKGIAYAPRLYWLKVRKLELLLLNGNICEYQTNRKTLSCKNKRWNRYIVMMDSIVSFLQQKEINKSISIENIDKEKSTLAKTYYVLTNHEKLAGDTLLALLSEVYNSPIKMYRSISAVMLSAYYRGVDDKMNARLYRESALNSAPSMEIRHFLEEILDNGHAGFSL